METARSEAPREGAAPDPAAERAAQVADNHSHPAPEARAELAQAPTDQTAPPPDAESAAAAGVADDANGGERRSVLSEFLDDGPPQIQEDGQASGDRGPVQLEREQAGTPPQPADDEPPLETAADVPVPDSGGSSFYDDDVGSLLPPLRDTPFSTDLGGDPILTDSADPLLVDQFGEPLVFSSLAAVELVGPIMNAPTPALEPLPTDPDPEADPLTERRIAAGEDIDGEDPSNGGLVSGTAGDDSLTGSAEDETIDGGPGDDTLTGGDGQDIFSFSVTDGGNDTVTDFEEGSGGDVVRLTDVTDADGDGTVDLGDLDVPGAGNSVSSPGGDSLVLGFASGASLTLVGVDGTGIGLFGDLAASNVNVDVA